MLIEVCSPLRGDRQARAPTLLGRSEFGPNVVGFVLDILFLFP